MLFDILRECNSKILSLNLRSNSLDDECMIKLGEFLQDNKYLEILDIGQNGITDSGVDILSDNLIGNRALQTLILDYNKGITDISFSNLLEIAKESRIVIISALYTSMSEEKQIDIRNTAKIPIDKREMSINSKSKSAAKINSAST